MIALVAALAGLVLRGNDWSHDSPWHIALVGGTVAAALCVPVTEVVYWLHRREQTRHRTHFD